MEIDLPTLVVLVVGGIALVVAVTHLTGGSQGGELSSDAQVREIWALDHRIHVSEVARSDDASAALLALADGSLGLVFVLGDRFVCRTLSADTVRSAHAHGDRLVVRLRDMGASRIVLRWTDATTRNAWQQRLEGL